jgi:hypothetical protein
MSMTNGLFVEKPPQHLAHSATSAVLQTNSGFHDWAVFNSEISAPTALSMVDVYDKWQDSLDATHTAYNVAFDTDTPFFKHLSQQPERHRQFAGYMRAVTSSQGTGLKQLVDGWDWAAVGNGLVVDVSKSFCLICLILKITGWRLDWSRLHCFGPEISQVELHC